MDQLIKEYEKAGKDWIEGKIQIKEFNGIKLNEKQRAFINSRTRYSLVYGGFASGKTTAFIIKLFLLSMFFPGNRILLGRKTRAEVEIATLPDIFDIFPAGTYTHKVGPGKIEFPNGSEILFFGLDALQSGAGQDIKKAEQKIKSLNLGAIFIDQLEEIEFRVFEALSGRLRRNVPFQQMNFTTNPANFWGYDYFKEHPRPNTVAIQTSMLDNKNNLSKEFLDDQMAKPKLYIEKYVYGNWSPEVLVEGTVFSDEYFKAQVVKNPIRVQNGIRIFEEAKQHEYQIGVDPSSGVEDPCAIVCVDKENGEVVATYSDYVNNEVQVERAYEMAIMYSRERKPLVVPEANSMGVAFIEKFKKIYDRIYERETFIKRERETQNKLGFATSFASKTQLIEHMKSLFHRQFPKIRDQRIVNEMQYFIYSDEARQKGAGAQRGYHDDLIMAMMLAYWNIMPITAREKNLLDRESRPKRNRKVQFGYI